MKIDIKDASQILSHILLKDSDLVDSIAATEEWKEDGVITAKVFFNSVEVSAESFERTLKSLMQQVEEHYSSKYDSDNIDNLVEERAKALLQEQADNALEKIYKLARALEESEDLIKPHWKR